uniref:Glutaredoxin-like protein n=1 Tax=Anthurium amnicola TaxID=1678845 RepID=A0A1D1XYZ3_9ARAE
MAAAAALRPPGAASLGRSRVSAARWPLLRPLVSAICTSPGGGSKKKQLVLYTKQGCCLCEGLKEKLEAAFLLGGPHSLHAVQLQVRDILEKPEWERLYQYEIPVLTRVLPDGSEEILPRLSPRLGVELIQKKISSALED